jgi:predicted Abi (CAAX) family protease
VDVVTGLLMGHLGVQGYIGVQSGLSLAVLCYAIYHFRGHTLKRALLTLPIIAESAVYGLAMGFLILLVMEEQHLLGPMSVPSGLLDWTVLSAGAGLHEELLFRLMLLPAMALGLEYVIAMPKPLAWGVAAIGSSLLFAGAHHLAGEPFEVYAFTYRTFAGLFFAGVFLTRGFAVATWTHAIYDLHVLWGTG